MSSLDHFTNTLSSVLIGKTRLLRGKEILHHGIELLMVLEMHHMSPFQHNKTTCGHMISYIFRLEEWGMHIFSTVQDQCWTRDLGQRLGADISTILCEIFVKIVQLCRPLFLKRTRSIHLHEWISDLGCPAFDISNLFVDSHLIKGDVRSCCHK